MRALLQEARESGCTDVHIIGGQPPRLRRLTELEPVGKKLSHAVGGQRQHDVAHRAVAGQVEQVQRIERIHVTSLASGTYTASKS